MKLLFDAVSTLQTASKNNQRLPRYGPSKFKGWKTYIGIYIGKNAPKKDLNCHKMLKSHQIYSTLYPMHQPNKIHQIWCLFCKKKWKFGKILAFLSKIGHFLLKIELSWKNLNSLRIFNHKAYDAEIWSGCSPSRGK